MPVRKVNVDDFLPFHDNCEAMPLDVKFSSVEGLISAAVTEDGQLYGVTMKKLDAKNIELECACEQEEGVCSHAAHAFYAYLRNKAAAEPKPVKKFVPKPKVKAVAPPQQNVQPAKSFSFAPATREASFLKLGIYGPSGSGKTMSALRIAKGITEREGGKIAVIDTEYGSASKYADRFTFSQLSLEHTAPPEHTIMAMAAAEDAEFNVLIIDSSSHEWGAVKDFVTEISKKSAYRNNTFAAWREGTPKQQAFVMAILSFPGHVICTMRSKTEWLVEKDEKGKTRPVRVGLAPEQGKGIEYEFDMLMFLTPQHVAEIEKDRTGKFQDQVIDKPSEEFGRQVSEWLRPAVEEEEPSPRQKAEAAEEVE